MNKRPSVTILAIIALPMSLSSCGFDTMMLEGDFPANLHIIKNDSAYRSAQPKADELVGAIELFDIRTVINLRGENIGKPWYDDEVEVCESMGITHVDHRMSARSLPSPTVLAEIVNTLQTAEHPILIHCQAGADRAGAISAIYRMLILGDEKKDALTELSIAYFHFRFATPCMDTLAEMYEPTEEWLATYADIVDTTVCQ